MCEPYQTNKNYIRIWKRKAKSEKRTVLSSGFNGFLMLNKEIKRHEYFTDYKTFHLYFWLLSDANFIDGNFRGTVVKRGQKLTSINSLVIETGLTVREVRTALDKLIKGNYIVKKATNKNQLLTVVEYEYYTGFVESKDKPKTNQRQTEGKPKTTIEEYNNTKKEIIKKESVDVDSNLSHFDYLNKNFNKELIELVTEYKPKIIDWDFCIEKFNDMDYKRVTIVILKSWLKREYNFIITPNANNSNQNDISKNHPSRKRII